MKPTTRTKHKKIVPSLPQQQLCIKTTSIHNYSELKHLKDTLANTQTMILIARIKAITSKDPRAEDKLVKELYSDHYVKNSYSIFQLGEERIILVPNIIQSKEVLL